ncbi:MAG: hypothetical protein HY914_09760 [Desulfomonile tiedjei]|nr:hypothetical protein [Desulfomonile tiedjei]
MLHVLVLIPSASNWMLSRPGHGIDSAATKPRDAVCPKNLDPQLFDRKNRLNKDPARMVG